MRRSFLSWALICLLTSTSFAQEQKVDVEVKPTHAARSISVDVETKKKPVAALHSYVVKITEFRMNGHADEALPTKDIALSFEKLQKEGKADVLETVRLSVLEDHESMMQVGSREPIVTATNTSAAFERRQRSYQFMNVAQRLR